MEKFYLLKPDKASRHTGDINASHKWALPGVRCPGCGASWAGAAVAYPSVSLEPLPERELFLKARPEPLEEFLRLRELVRPLVSSDAPLKPGTEFGPLMGTAIGSFGPFFFQNPWTLLVRSEVLARLEAEQLRGLNGCQTGLRFRQKAAPALLELQIEPYGRLHPDCTPPRTPPCTKCGRDAFTFPEQPILDAASLPTHTDLFRLADFETMIVGTERFVTAVQRLELGEIVFREVPVR